MPAKIVAIAGGSGFIGRAIARRLAAIGDIKVRVITRNPDAAYERLKVQGVEFVRGDIADPATLKDSLAGASAIVDAVQFDGYPIENPRRGLTFERVDYGGTVSLLAAAKDTGVGQFVYISGAAADENREHPGFRSKGLAERAIRESGLEYTILRPSLVYGPEDHTVNLFARMLKVAPVFPVPGTGKQRVQPVFVEDVAACVALAL
ncbi:MAG TPA: NAD-dependent epimerase/dehydratase family protein, partial [Sporolactobacillaceae bacterium]|nr:NAD-dependent epimerase/dehydratase family protein [Sporolactobacillaceae bacterium]